METAQRGAQQAEHMKRQKTLALNLSRTARSASSATRGHHCHIRLSAPRHGSRAAVLRALGANPGTFVFGKGIPPHSCSKAGCPCKSILNNAFEMLLMSPCPLAFLRIPLVCPARLVYVSRLANPLQIVH